MEPRIAALEARLDTLIPTLATKADVGEIRADLHKMDASIVRWTIATVIGLFLGFAGLFFVVVKTMKPTAPPAASAPIIIQVPQPAALPAIQAPTLPLTPPAVSPKQ